MTFDTTINIANVIAMATGLCILVVQWTLMRAAIVRMEKRDLVVDADLRRLGEEVQTLKIFAARSDERYVAILAKLDDIKTAVGRST